ncbi:MAG: helix-turn-helix transcriptional regulator [Acidobacteria bacterium]|nr:helix-turn-helix transcriptional regulator [Acidobacteriota bacterium]
MRRTPRDEAPKALSQPVVHILLALADGARHGYAIKQAVEERTQGAVRLGPGTLYEAIQRLQDDGRIEETAARGEEPSNGQHAQRRYYALTDQGWDVLRDELQRLDAIVAHARANPKLRKGLV